MDGPPLVPAHRVRVWGSKATLQSLAPAALATPPALAWWASRAKLSSECKSYIRTELSFSQATARMCGPAQVTARRTTPSAPAVASLKVLMHDQAPEPGSASA